MTTVITVANQKGGVGKSTIARAIGNAGIVNNKRVLTIDLDPQGNISYSLGVNPSELEQSAYHVLIEGEPINNCIYETPQGDIVASSNNLSIVERTLGNEPDAELILKNQLDQIKDSYDLIIIDTPPTLGVLMFNALTASDLVIIPTQAEVYSLQGLDQLSETIDAVQSNLNPSLEVAGIVITRYDKRTIYTQQLTEMLQEQAELFNTKVFDTKIREAIAVKESQITQTNLFEYAPKANVTNDFTEFINELNIL